MKRKQTAGLYGRIREILEAARIGVARTVNTTQVVSNWLIGREIIEEEQKGKARAGYGDQAMLDLASRLHEEYGPGYGLVNLELFKQFYRLYPELAWFQKGYAARSQFAGNISDVTRRKSGKRPAEAGPAAGGKSSIFGSRKSKPQLPIKRRSNSR